jgi:Flp pilus assembly protein TadG
MRPLISKFVRDVRGSIALIFSFSFIVLMACVGGAIDFGAYYASTMRLQAAVDAATLAGAVATGDDARRKSVARSYLERNFKDHASVNLGIEVVNNDVVMTASSKHHTSILKAAGIPYLNYKAQATVPLVTSGKAEIVLVLDYSDSMLQYDKYIRARDAAIQLIDHVSNNGANTNVKVGVVPFAAMVRVDLPSSYIRSDIGTYSGCTQDRRFPHNGEETAGTAGDASRWGEVTSGHICSEMDTAGLRTIPLTDNLADVKSRISAMQPHLWTHIALGAEIGWQVLSPSGPFATAKPYDEKQLTKVLVLMTDGMQTAPGWGVGGTKTTTDAEANLLRTCAGMKSRGIQVFTVGYDLTDAHTLDLLRNCASADSFYDAKDVGGGLMASFQAISSSVKEMMVRLSK